MRHFSSGLYSTCSRVPLRPVLSHPLFAFTIVLLMISMTFLDLDRHIYKARQLNSGTSQSSLGQSGLSVDVHFTPVLSSNHLPGATNPSLLRQVLFRQKGTLTKAMCHPSVLMEAYHRAHMGMGTPRTTLQRLVRDTLFSFDRRSFVPFNSRDFSPPRFCLRMPVRYSASEHALRSIHGTDPARCVASILTW